MLITLYNAVYQDGRDPERLPRALAWPVRAALIVGPALAALAFWALLLRIRQHCVSEDRLQALVVVTILAGYLIGYALVAAAGTRAPFAVRHVNVVMALVLVGTLIAIHSPLVDLKRAATAAQLRRVSVDGTNSTSTTCAPVSGGTDCWRSRVSRTPRRCGLRRWRSLRSPRRAPRTRGSSAASGPLGMTGNGSCRDSKSIRKAPCSPTI
jgi:hypothetical protein